MSDPRPPRSEAGALDASLAGSLFRGLEPAPGADERIRAARVTPRKLLAFARAWAPVWVPLALLAQVALLGYRPVREERARLGAWEAHLTERRDAALERRDHLARRLEAYRDPIYLERERRWLLVRGAPR